MLVSTARLTLIAASICTRRFATAAMGDAARDRMMGEIASAGNCEAGDASGKKILARGCDRKDKDDGAEYRP